MIKIDFNNIPEPDQAALKKLADAMKFTTGSPNAVYHVALMQLKEAYLLGVKKKEA